MAITPELLETEFNKEMENRPITCDPVPAKQFKADAVALTEDLTASKQKAR